MTRVLLFIVIVANIATAIGVVYARHQHRVLFVQLNKLDASAMSSTSSSAACNWSRPPWAKAPGSSRSPATGWA